MKRFLLLFLGIMIATIAMAADVITKKNGTTIQCKVMKVGRTEVEYKNITNLDGPVYALDLTEISSITYENGAVDKFGEQSVVTTNAGQRTMTDGELMRIYRAKQPGKVWKTAGYILGGLGIGVASLDIFASRDGAIERGMPIFIGVPILVVGIGSYTFGCIQDKKAERNSYTSIYQQNFQLGNNTMLSADVNMINDNITHDKSLGLGLRFTF